ncbi:MAG: hypothetical protein AAGA20_14585 [Planctomycetota bacterium]
MAPLLAAAASLAVITFAHPQDLSSLAGTVRSFEQEELGSLEEAGVMRRLGTPPRSHRGAVRALWRGGAVLTVSRHGDLVRWNPDTGEQLDRISPEPIVGEALVDAVPIADGAVLVLGSDGTVAPLDADGLEVAGDLRSLDVAAALVVSPDGETVLGLRFDGERVKTYGVGRGRARRGPSLGEGVVTASIADGAKRIATVVEAQGRQRIVLLDSKGRRVDEEVLEILANRSDRVLRSIGAVALSGDAKSLAIGGNGRVALVDFAADDVRFEAEFDAGRVRCLSWSDGGDLVAGTDDGHVVVVDGRSGDVRARRRLHGSPVIDATMSASGETVASVGDAGDVRLLDAKTGDEIAGTGWLDGPIGAIGFSADGTDVAFGGFGGGIAVALDGGPPVLVPQRHEASVIAVALFGNDRLFSAARGELARDGRIGEKDARTLHALEAGEQRVVVADVCEDGPLVALGFDGGLHVYQILGGRAQSGETGFGIADLALAAIERNGEAYLTDEGLLLIQEPGSAEWSYEEQSIPPPAEERERRIGLEYLGDETIIVEKVDGTLELWSLDGDVKNVIDLRGEDDDDPRRWAYGVSPGGRWIVTERPGVGLVVVDPSSGERAAELGYPAPGATAVAVSQDGRRIALGRADGTALVWDLGAFETWNDRRSREGGYVPALGAREAVRDAGRQAKRALPDLDRAGAHLISGTSLLRGMPAGKERDRYRESFVERRQEAGLGDGAFTAMAAEIAEQWVALGMEYAGSDLAHAALDCALVADDWAPGGGDPLLELKGVLAAAEQREQTLEPIEQVAAGDAEADDPLPLQHRSISGFERTDELWRSSLRAKGGRGVVARRPGTFEEIELVADFSVASTAALEVQFGLRASGAGGFGFRASMNARGDKLDLSIEDRAKNERVALRRFSVESFPDVVELRVTVEDGRIVGTWNGEQSVMATTEKKLRGYVGFAAFGLDGLARRAAIRSLSTDPQTEPIRGSRDGLMTTSEELPLDEQLREIERSLTESGVEERDLVRLHALRFDAERLPDEAARRVVAGRVATLESTHDPLAAKRSATLDAIADKLMTRAEAVAGERPWTALALIDLARVRDDEAVESRVVALSAPLAPVLAARRGLAKEPAELYALPEGPSPLAQSVDPWRHPWTVDAGELSTIPPSDSNALLVTPRAIAPEGLEVAVQLLSGERCTQAIAIGVQPNWDMVCVTRQRDGRDVRLNIWRVTNGVIKTLESSPLRFQRDAVTDWMTLRVEYDAATATLEATLGAAEPLTVKLDEPLKAGRIGTLVYGGGTEEPARFRGLRIGE